MVQIQTEQELAALCMGLGARLVAGWSAEEEALIAGLPAWQPQHLGAVRKAICSGQDPLGDAFCALRSPAARRPLGATYTPPAIVDAMLQWARSQGQPARVIDPGSGSGRFLVAAGRAFPDAHLLGLEIDPLAALMTRARLVALGLAERARVLVCDYRAARLDAIAGATLFIGNPPYVRHHGIAEPWKRWLSTTAAAHGLHASQLAGLHVHFFVATLAHARPGDLGVFVTAAEWLDVNYGQIVRDLLASRLGCLRIDMIEPTASVFADAQTTAAITCFQVGAAVDAVHLRRVAVPGRLAPLRGGRRVSRQRLARATRWTPLFSAMPRSRSGRSSPGHAPARGDRVEIGELVELGALCRVHRGQVTGANKIWIASPATPPLPAAVLFPAITRARELFDAGQVLCDAAPLRRVIDLPAELDALAPADRDCIERFLDWARQHGAHTSYIARHRSPWWSVRLREPPPILATYMARRPPAFVRNRAGARFINIAHGIYPREPLAAACLDVLAAYLSRHVQPGQGRTYAGGLTKFEPREMERLLVPTPESLAQQAAALRAARA